MNTDTTLKEVREARPCVKRWPVSTLRRQSGIQKGTGREGQGREEMKTEGGMNNTLYDYSFSLWIDEPRHNGMPIHAVCECLRMGMSRCQMEFTESQFNIFRDQVGICGFSLREIERTPHIEPEVIL